MTGMAARSTDTAVDTDMMAITLAHELGHHFGLAHRTADQTQANLMFPELSVASLDDSLLTPDQVRELHDRLANHLGRRGERAMKPC